MAIGSSGALSFSDIQTEYGGSNPISLSEYYAGGSNVPSGISGDNGAVPSSGVIAISKFRGTSNVVDIALTISSTVQNYNIYANRGGTYAAGVSNITLTINAIVGSASSGQYALDTGNQWAAGDTIKIINNSQVIGCGGAGGAGGQNQGGQAQWPGSAGSGGGSAINLGFDTTIQNNGGFIRGAGGGGGGGGTASADEGTSKGANFQYVAGGGGGGGAGQNGGAAGAGGQDQTGSSYHGQAGQAGMTSGGTGGTGAAGGDTGNQATGGTGGTGGGYGAAGQTGATGSGRNNTGLVILQGAGGAGGAAGKAINLGGNTLTWEDGNTNVQGAVS